METADMMGFDWGFWVVFWFVYKIAAFWMIAVILYANRRMFDWQEVWPETVLAFIPVINIFAAIIFTMSAAADEWLIRQLKKDREKEKQNARRDQA